MPVDRIAAVGRVEVLRDPTHGQVKVSWPVEGPVVDISVSQLWYLLCVAPPVCILSGLTVLILRWTCPQSISRHLAILVSLSLIVAGVCSFVFAVA